MIFRNRLAVVAAVACTAVSPAFADHGWEKPGKERDKRVERKDGSRGQVHIPPGHLPAPGECRIWYPGRPAGHQPPPGDCAALGWRVPPGALLVEG